jgi:flagellar biosynthesis/type III secretory pathway protein FliH
MHDAFIPLAQWLAPATAIDEVAGAASDAGGHAEKEEARTESFDDECAALSDVRRFRAALYDALEVALGVLLREIAIDVVGRELALEPCNIERIVERARERYRFEEPLSVRVHPSDLERLPAPYRKMAVADESLRSGDLMLCVRSGTIDATLGARLERVLHEQIK